MNEDARIGIRSPNPTRMCIPRRLLLRSIVIGLTAFLTVVDLFATQAILPSLTRHYGVTPAAMGFAVNASTLGMAFSGLGNRLFQPRDRPQDRAS